MTAPEHRALPLRDYDHLPLASLRQRIRPLNGGEIHQLLLYEQEHANRPAAVQAMQTRLAELASGQAPTGGSQQIGPDWPESPSRDSLASPPKFAPPVSPPPHGNPAQPGKPKANRQTPYNP
jgi:hypothetical protein